MENEFIILCKNGNLEEVKQYYFENSNNNFNVSSEYIFPYICIKGYIELAKWLFSINPNIKNTICNSNIFKCACYNGHLELAKWLLDISPNINIFALDLYFVSIEIQTWLKFLKKCPICLKEMIGDCQTNCRHYFCKNCIDVWLNINNTCPNCRKEITHVNDIPIG